MRAKHQAQVADFIGQRIKGKINLSGKHYLYFYQNDRLNSIYIGIAKDMTRVWQDHNEDAERLRDMPGTQILQTIEPFSSRKDARKAEAIAISAASLSGKEVFFDDPAGEDTQAFHLTNRAGVLHTSELGPAVYTRPGTVAYSSLMNTAIVVLRPSEIDDRPAIHGGLSAARFADRARAWWRLATAQREGYPVDRLIAILKGSSIVLGDWDLDLDARFIEGATRRNWQFNLLDPEDDNSRGIKGMRLEFDNDYRVNQTQGYSVDVRLSANLA